MSKLSIYQAINKSFILWGIKPSTKVKIYYKFDLEKRKNPVRLPCIVVDYQENKREWLIFYMTDDKLYSSTVDDITGSASIQSFNDVN